MSSVGQPSAEGQRSPGSKARAVLVYTLLRVALFVVVWLLLEFLSPVKGLLAVVAALLISGAISVVVLDRPRGEFGSVAAGFFGRINARIDAASRAEDVDDEPETPPSAPSVEPPESGEPEEQSEHEAIEQQ